MSVSARWCVAFQAYCFALCSEHYVGAGEDYMLDYCFIRIFLLPKTTDKKMKVSLSLPVLCAFTSMWLWRMKTSHIAVAPNRVSLQETHDF